MPSPDGAVVDGDEEFLEFGEGVEEVDSLEVVELRGLGEAFGVEHLEGGMAFDLVEARAGQSAGRAVGVVGLGVAVGAIAVGEGGGRLIHFGKNLLLLIVISLRDVVMKPCGSWVETASCIQVEGRPVR